MSSSKWVPVCKWCGLRLNAKVVTANGLNPPSRPPKDCEAYGAPLATYGAVNHQMATIHICGSAGFKRGKLCGRIVRLKHKLVGYSSAFKGGAHRWDFLVLWAKLHMGQ